MLLLFDLVEGSLSVQLKRPKMDVKRTLEAARLLLHDKYWCQISSYAMH